VSADEVSTPVTAEFENDHNVYVLGAGASADAGLPGMLGFLNHMRDAYDWLAAQGGRAEEQEAIARVLRYRLTAASASYRVPLDVENIEELFSLASASGDEATSVSSAIAATLDYCRATARCPTVTVEFDIGQRSAPSGWGKPSREAPTVGDGGARWAHFERPRWELYGGVLGGALTASSGRNTVITFNYDMVIEEAFGAFGTTYDYGFGKKSVNYQHDPRGEVNVHLLKLHGSVNWAYRSGKGRSFTVYGNYGDVVKLGFVPELVPPTWRKVFAGPFDHVWRAAVRAIRDATRIVILGFSMPPTDVHFKYLLAAGLNSNISLRRIDFVNPHASRLTAALKGTLRPELFERVVFRHDLKAHQYLLVAERLKEIKRELSAVLRCPDPGP
jgi:hypothetical protein